MFQPVPARRSPSRPLFRLLLPLIALSALAAGAVLPPTAPRPAVAGQRATLGGQSACGTVIQVDVPAAGGSVTGPARVAGWAVDTGATADTGVTAVQIWVDGTTETGTLAGDAKYGLPRPDLVDSLGPNFANAAFEFTFDPKGLSPGPHTLAVYAQTACGWQGVEVPITVAQNNCAAQLQIEFPPAGSKVPSPGEFLLTGYAIDPKSTTGTTGVDDLKVTLGPDGAGPVVGVVRSRLPRIDVAATNSVTGTRFLTAGWAAYLDSRQLKPDAGAGTTGKTTFTVTGATKCGPVSQTIALEMAIPGDETKAATAVLPPKNLRITRYQNGLVILAWDPSPNQKVTGYTITMSKGGAGFRIHKTVSAAELLAEVGGLDQTESYAFQVYANVYAEQSGPSNVVGKDTPISALGPLPLPPADPTSRPANDLTPTPDPKATATPAGVAASSGGGNFFGLPGGGSAGAVPTPNDATPTPGAPAQPPPPAGNSAIPTATPTPNTTLLPPLILGCNVGGAGNRQVTCTFNAVPTAQSYQLTRSSTSNGAYTQVATANASQTQVVDASVAAAGTFYYQLVALGPAGAKSPPSNTVPVTVR